MPGEREMLVALEQAQTALASSLFLLRKHLPHHHWMPQIGQALGAVKAVRASLAAQPQEGSEDGR